MARIYFVRHGEAAAGWGDDEDPPLSEKGQLQAEAVARELLDLVDGSEFQVISSPIRRARETAIPFCKLVSREAGIERRVAEIPSPVTEMDQRMPWLVKVMRSRWPDLSPELQEWRQQCIDYLNSLEQDTVIFSHFIAINVAIGHCRGDDKVLCYHPDNTSISIFENAGKLAIVSLGREGQTKIN